MEIVAELEKQMPESKSLTPENMGSLKTLKDICLALETEHSDKNEPGTVHSDKAEQDSNFNESNNLNDSDNFDKSGNTDETGKLDQKLQNQTISSSNNSSRAIMEILVKTVSSLTGFPEEMLEPEMDLESDLGIDSIKRVEIVAELEKQMPDSQSLTPEIMGSLKTLEDICMALETEHSDKNEPGTEHSGKAEQKAEQDSNFNEPDNLNDAGHFDKSSNTDGTGKPDEKLKPLENYEEKESVQQNVDKNPGAKEKNNKILRQTITLKRQPIDLVRFHNGSKLTISDEKKIYITRDSAGIAESFKNEFEKNGIKAQLIDINNRENINPEDAAGLVIVSDSLSDHGKNKDLKSQKNSGLNENEEFLKSAFSLAKKFSPFLIKAASRQGAFFTTVSFLGGDFGFEQQITSDPVQGGLAGLSKTAAKEWEGVLCKSIDMADSLKKCIKNAEAAVSLFMTHGSVEMGINDDLCIFPELRAGSDSGEPEPDAGAELTNGDVIVITGGAKGVTAECAFEIAKKYSPQIILLGRSKKPYKEPEWVKNLTGQAEIKKELLKNNFQDKKVTPGEIQKAYKEIVSNREINKNLERIKTAGSRVKYFSTDIRDEKNVNKILNNVRNEFGSITCVIHGAGILEDRLICDKTEEQFAKVFDTKVKGFNTLLKATKNDNLKYFILFSSVAARTGNKGQVDYAMANEVLNKTAQKKARENKNCRFISVNWGPWEGGMVNSSLQREFLKRGIDLIPLKQGAKSLVAEMERNDRKDVEVVIGAHIIQEKSLKPHIHEGTYSSEQPSLHGIRSAAKEPSLHSIRSAAEEPSLHSIKSAAEEPSLKPSLATAFKQSVGIDSYPILNSHKIDNEPVVPFALIVEWFAHAAEYLNPGLYFAGLDQIRLFKGIKPGLSNIDIDIKTGKCRPENSRFKTDIEAVSTGKNKKNFLHSSAVAILTEKLPKAPVHDISDHMNLKPCSMSIKDAYSSVLFHGKNLQGIKSITGCSSRGIEVIASRGPEPFNWITTPFKKRWTADPLLLDSAFQAAILWAYETTGKVCLPSYMANFRIYSSFTKCKGDVKIILTINEKTEYGLKGYFTFLDQDGIVIAGITGFEAVTDPSLLTKFKPERIEYNRHGRSVVSASATTNVESSATAEVCMDFHIKGNESGNTDFKSTNPGNTGSEATASGATASGETASGETASGETEYGETEYGETAFGETEYGEIEYGETEYGETEPENHNRAKKELFTREQILSFALGKPSKAFGEKYKIFDNERKIARLPRPPYFFMDRIIKTEPVQWEMKAGGWIEAEFDIPENGWYFRADRSDYIPFSILLEIALQPCGWLAAYAGSALKSDKRLFFRNLGGNAKIIKHIHKDMGTITMRSCMRNVSEAGGLIIQDFEMEILKDGDYLYKGNTNFGFFTKEALANQTGIKNSTLDYVPLKEELNAAQSFKLKDEAPLEPQDPDRDKNSGMPSKALRMIDTIDLFIPTGGKYKKGYIKASKIVDPNEWFFNAHFYQDPVCPGSLGIESFLQLIRFFALKTLKYFPDKFQLQMGNNTHKWSYRGQIIPTNSKVEVQAHIKDITQGDSPVITADGILSVDGLTIYQMEDFSMNLVHVPDKADGETRITNQAGSLSNLSYQL
ncbi:MAG: SDR family oxidoreductase [Thermodesulfobacteriota bacterium]|nr:SDR family oxidoreductase [Thermodesulfobacteriota bacterium]